jgi:hypothetical protein
MRLILFLPLLFFSFYAKSCQLGLLLESIPKEDLAELDGLFSYFIKQNQFAYTLFGDKPISLSSQFSLTPWENIIEKINDKHTLFWKKWKIWKKYEHFFPSKNYLLTIEPSKFPHVYDIILINKIEFIKTLEKHQKLFESVIGHPINPQQLLNEIEQKKISFSDSIKNNQMLGGILLGYGVHNSTLYNKRDRGYLNNIGLMNHSKIILQPIEKNHYMPLIIGPVKFAADILHPETIALRKKYKKLRGKISSIYFQNNLLEVTLLKLMSQ